VSLSVNGLKQLLSKNVVELRFTRRMQRANRPTTRRMLCSLNLEILNSPMGLKFLNFRLPTNSPAYNFESYNLLAVYDIFMQDWRAVPAGNASVVQVLASTPEEFWKYFSEILIKMSAQEKAQFMDK
jgi:hypothetical protein